MRFGAISSARLNNFTATTNPAVTDDTGSGYAPGSLWLNTTSANMFICIDATASAAVWKLITPGSFAVPGSFDSAMPTVIPRPIGMLDFRGTLTLTTTKGFVNLMELHAAIAAVRASISVLAAGPAGALARVAVYSFDGATKLIDVTIAVGAGTGAMSNTFGAVSLAAGYYWALICRADAVGGASPTINGHQTLNATGSLSAPPVAGLVWEHGSVAVTAGAAPSSIDPTSLTSESHMLQVRLDNA